MRETTNTDPRVYVADAVTVDMAYCRRTPAEAQPVARAVAPVAALTLATGAGLAFLVFVVAQMVSDPPTDLWWLVAASAVAGALIWDTARHLHWLLLVAYGSWLLRRRGVVADDLPDDVIGDVSAVVERAGPGCGIRQDTVSGPDRS